MEYLTEEELKQLFDSTDTSTKIVRRNILIVVLLYYAATRTSEMLNLKIKDIHLEQNILFLGKKLKI